MATGKGPLPSIADDLAPSAPRPDLRKLRSPSVSDERVEIAAKELGASWGASTRIQSPTIQTPMTSVRLDLPEYVDKMLKLKVAQEGGTKAFYILQALAKVGWDIHEEDIKPDRRRRLK